MHLPFNLPFKYLILLIEMLLTCLPIVKRLGIYPIYLFISFLILNKLKIKVNTFFFFLKKKIMFDFDRENYL